MNYMKPKKGLFKVPFYYSFNSKKSANVNDSFNLRCFTLTSRDIKPFPSYLPFV